jgi:hypothetical protein
MHRDRKRSVWVGSRLLLLGVLSIVALGGLAGCAGLREAVALHQVDFRYDRISNPAIAGLPLSRIQRYEDLSIVDVGRLALAIASKDVPLDIIVHLEGKNPATNNTTARMMKLDWAYLVDDRSIISGQLVEEIAFRPGEASDVPVGVRFNLVDFFGNDGHTLFDTALVLSGQRTTTKRVTLRLTPTIETSLGPIRYPVPITLDLAARN